MTQSAVVDLSKSQLAFAGNRLRAMAVRLGVSWLIWPPARLNMQLMEVDEVDVVQAVQTIDVTRAEAWGEAVRYVGVGHGIDGNLLEVKCVDHGDLLVIEVFAVSLL
jgi:hypothetical protein